MRFGLNFTPAHRSAEEWGDYLKDHGFTTAVFPVDYRAEDALIEGYINAARERDITFAEVGVWNSPWVPDEKAAREAKERCLGQLELAERAGARCCVNVSGAAGEVWCGCFRENFSEELYKRNVSYIQELLDTAEPSLTYFTLEPMQWMVPDSPEQYEKILRDVGRERFAVHMDIVNWVKDPYTYTHQDELIHRAFSRLGDQIRSCHLKDCVLDSHATVSIHETEPGTGQMDIVAYLRAISQLDKDMPVLLEHLPDEEAYLRAAGRVREIWQKAGGSWNR